MAEGRNDREMDFFHDLHLSEQVACSGVEIKLSRENHKLTE